MVCGGSPVSCVVSVGRSVGWNVLGGDGAVMCGGHVVAGVVLPAVMVTMEPSCDGYEAMFVRGVQMQLLDVEFWGDIIVLNLCLKKHFFETYCQQLAKGKPTTNHRESIMFSGKTKLYHWSCN